MGKIELPADALPDIEMYGGDTVPWEITLIRDDGTKYLFDTAEECTCTLTFTPFKVTTGLGGRAKPVTPSMMMTGTVKAALDGTATVVFNFAKEDTIGLRGKFLYQIEVAHDTDLRIAQGHIYIKQNTNR